MEAPGPPPLRTKGKLMMSWANAAVSIAMIAAFTVIAVVRMIKD